ncbi:hypothetical protein FRB99_007157 [Tulasnella sp. 403]|nr:hypothetical protein FRB99_007157 [Tulasnella sp. 403]
MPRIMKGSRFQSARPSVLQLSDIDSAFPLQEYIAYLVQRDPHDVNSIVSIPETRHSRENESPGAGLGLGMDEKDGTVDEACWIYEQLRRLAQDLTHPLITSLQAECNRSTCPEMKAGEWLYLCVAHGAGPSATMEQCCAIDYITHTLDSATALLNSPRAFPSRLQIPPASVRQFPSLARRLSRIFAHAYYHHREAFEQSEAESSLYARFLLLAKRFDLVPADFLVLPGSANTSNAPSITAPPSAINPELDLSNIEQPAGHALPASSSMSPQHPQGILEPKQNNRYADAADEPTDGVEPGTSPYPNMTVRSSSLSGSMVDAERRTIINRSRTDTMYLKDFDLSEFAVAAGDAMAAVKAEDAGIEDISNESSNALEGNVEEDDGYIEVQVAGDRAVTGDQGADDGGLVVDEFIPTDDAQVEEGAGEEEEDEGSVALEEGERAETGS